MNTLTAHRTSTGNRLPPLIDDLPRTTRFAPADRQIGSALVGPTCFPPPDLPRPRSVATFGIEAESEVRKAILWEVFGPRHVHARTHLQNDRSTDEAVVVRTLPAAEPATWSQFVGRLGARSAVVDLRALATMLRAEGLDAEVRPTGIHDPEAVDVFRCRLDTEVYPEAPGVEVVQAPELVAGFGVGDRFHLYRRDGDTFDLDTLPLTDGLEAELGRRGWRVWGRDTLDGNPALLEARTPAGGRVLVMDLGTLEQPADPSGRRALAVHLLLAGLGVSPVTFGKFCTAVPIYEDFVEQVRRLAEAHPALASLEPVGRSTAGRTMWALRIGIDRRKPTVLLTSGIHPLEWAPTYGVLRYLRHLLEQAAADTDYARDLLGDRQVMWVLSLCPDGWESRDLQPSGVNLEINFPAGYDRSVAGARHWDAYNRKWVEIQDADGADEARGPAPLSQPETQAMAELLDRDDLTFSTTCDFHETTAPKSFIHQVETEAGVIPDLPYHCDLVDAVARGFNGRFFGHMNVVAYRPALADFSTWTFRGIRSLDRLVTKTCLGWLPFAAARGVRGVMVEAQGCDCTHYQTIHRTEYAALVAEQVLAAELGGLLRNPWGGAWDVEVPLQRRSERLHARLYRADGSPAEVAASEDGKLRCSIPPGGWLRWRLDPPADPTGELAEAVGG